MSSSPEPVSGGPIQIEIWTELGCPWCYVGAHRLDRAIVETGVEAKIVLRSFELHPDSPTDVIETIPEFFVRVHGGTLEHARSMEAQLGAIAAAEGLPFEIERPAVNTFDVHRMLQLANDHGVGTVFFSRAQMAYFAGELNPYDLDALVSVAVEAGVPAERASEVLRGEEYADAVLADRERGIRLGVTGVPFIVYGGRVATAGAQSEAGFAEVLRRVASGSPA